MFDVNDREHPLAIIASFGDTSYLRQRVVEMLQTGAPLTTALSLLALAKVIDES